MSTHRRRATSSPDRLVWGGIALLLLAALFGSVAMSRSALRHQEEVAQARAAGYVRNVLSDALTPHIVSEPILGSNYRELIITVQSGILFDDRVARVRIWKTDGTLIFSSDQRDRIGELVAPDSPQIRAAADGGTVSLVTETTVAPKSGLAGADETLYETFVPLRLPDELGISGVVQIDQRYSTIQSAADHLWRPVQIGLILALLTALVLLVRSIRRPVAESAAQTLRDVRPSQATGAPSELAEAEARAEKAEHAQREIQARLDAELSAKATRAAEAGASSPSVASIKALETKLHDAEIELNAKLGAAEAEREHLSGEVQRLRAALVERDGELAIAREGATGEAETAAKATEMARATEQRISELEQRSHAAEQRAMVAEQRVSEIEGELRLAAAARESLDAAAKRTVAGGESKAGAELRQARLQLNELLSKLAEAETALEDATATGLRKDASLAEVRAQHDRVRSDLDSVRSTLLKREDELKAFQHTVAAKEGEVAGKETEIAAKQAAVEAAAGNAAEAERRAEETEAQVKGLEERTTTAEAGLAELSESRAKLQAELEASKAAVAQAEARRTELEVSVAKSDAARTEAEAAKTALEAERAAEAKKAGAAERSVAKVGELEARVAELEELRRGEVAELQRAQEALANTQVESAQAAKRAKDAEARVRELEEAPQGAREAAPQPTYDAPEEFLQPSITSRLAALRREAAPEAEPIGEEEAASPDEGLSLRERLARAAAARHRPSGTGEN
jgi:chromosome segregation ATPase